MIPKSCVKENLPEDTLLSAQESLRETLRAQKSHIAFLRSELLSAEKNFSAGVSLSEDISRAIPHTIEVFSGQKTPTTRARSISPEEANQIIEKVLSGAEKATPEEILMVGTMLVHQIRRQNTFHKKQEIERQTRKLKVQAARENQERNEYGLKFCK